MMKPEKQTFDRIITKPMHVLDEETLLKLVNTPVPAPPDALGRTGEETSLDALRTVLIDPDDQDDSIQQTLEKVSRAEEMRAKGSRVFGHVVQLVGTVSPSVDTVAEWARVHKAHSVLALDSDAENIEERLRDGAILMIASDMPIGRGAYDVTDSYVKHDQLSKRRESWDKLERSVDPQHKQLREKRFYSGRSSASGRVSNHKNWDGDLGGGPLRVPGIINRSPK